ncbi:MAG TPA: hypothetical protein PK299_00090 [Anaerolineales bacterium]|nr:hypothetical protein [Anaerolineales bacterium]
MIPGTVAHTLMMMNGIWHDHIELFDLMGNPLPYDDFSGTPGAAPFDNLVYIHFDGETYLQTNVTFAGRPLHVRSFSGKIIDGVLVFDRLGPQAPEHIGVSGGYGILIYAPRQVDEAWQRYNEPDYIRILSPGVRTRTTILYRHGMAVRTLTAHGTLLSPVANQRVSWDPRGAEGAVHNIRSSTQVFAAQPTSTG